ncbi:MAG: hypothetical protein PHD12_04465 [Methylotenera sp.]|nr:hypothetical protein [Methylotenera sp.]
MNKNVQENLNAIIAGYYSTATEAAHHNWREIAAHVYANALRDPDISWLDLLLTYKPLKTIASAASFTENAGAVMQAVTSPLTQAASTVREGGFLASAAHQVMDLNHDPLANVKALWHGLEATGESAKRLFAHETGLMSMNERLRLAEIYDLPHQQRIEALHGMTLQDTASMVAIGSLPQMLPKAGNGAGWGLSESKQAAALELANYPVRYAENMLVLTAAEPAVDWARSGMMTMATKGYEGNAPIENKGFDIRKYEFPDPDFDMVRFLAKDKFYYQLNQSKEVMGAHGLKNEYKLFKQNLDYLLDVRITQSDEEYQQVLTATKLMVDQAAISIMQTVQPGLEGEVLDHNAAQSLNAHFSGISQFIEQERLNNMRDLALQEASYQRQESARLNPDSVGYDRSVTPRSVTERELHHHVYWQKMYASVDDLKVKLELLGLRDRAEALDAQVEKLLRVRLEDSKAEHQKDMAALLKIEEDAKLAHYVKTTPFNISERYFNMIQSDIGGELAQLLQEIEHEREYQIRHQLWRRQHGDERRETESAMITAVREKLFGNTQDAMSDRELGPEL